jgi:hypothetical protein
LLKLVVTSGVGTAIVPHNFRVRDSKDGRMHICIHDVWSFAFLCRRGCGYCGPRLLVRTSLELVRKRGASQELAQGGYLRRRSK